MSTPRMVATVGPRYVFKHIVLNRLLRAMREKHQNSWSYIDFTPGPGKYTCVDGGLSYVWADARKKFQGRKVNFFSQYLGALQKFNGEQDAQTRKVPPAVGYEPSVYPSSAGFADMYLRDIDRAVYLDHDAETLAALREFIGPDDRKRQVINIVNEKTKQKDYTLWARKVVPPASKRGMVTLDIDAMVERVHAPEMTFTGQFNHRHADLIMDMSGVVNKMIQRWPTGTFFIPYPMTSHIPPVQLVREILKSKATQVLNVSMFLEGEGHTDNPHFAGDGIGALIINPPAGVDVDLHNHLPGLKSEVFMPAILVEENEKERPARVHWLNRPDNEQPWDHMLESDRRQTWEYFRKVEWPVEVEAEYERNVERGHDAYFQAWLDHDEDGWMDELYDSVNHPPAPEPLDKDCQSEWRDGVRQQEQLQDPVRPTVIRRRKH